MDCWTLWGMKKASRSLLLAVRRDLIKVLPPFPAQEVVVEVFGGKGSAPSKEKFRLDHSPQKLLQGHAVVVEETGQGHGRGGQDAHPAGRLLPDDRPQAQVDAGGRSHGDHGAEELPGGQAEEDGLLVLADLFGNFDLDNKSPHILAKI